MMHLNDSASTLASGKDKHAGLCHGNIWKSYNMESGHLKLEDSGLIAILEWAEMNDIALILERDSTGISKDLQLLQQLGFFA
jgi:endonuclease IV